MVTIKQAASNKMEKNIAVMCVEMDHMKTDIAEIKKDAKDHYKSDADWHKDIDDRISKFAEKIDKEVVPVMVSAQVNKSRINTNTTLIMLVLGGLLTISWRVFFGG